MLIFTIDYIILFFRSRKGMMKGLIGFSSQEQLDDDLANEFESDALDVKVSSYMYSLN